VDLPVPGSAPAANRGGRRAAGEIEVEFLLEGLAEFVALEFVEKLLERRTIADLSDRKAAGLANFRIVRVD